jgi:preprotein translocase subunit SecA
MADNKFYIYQPLYLPFFYLLPIKAIIWNLILNLGQIVKKIDGQWYKVCQDKNENTVTELLNETLMDFAEITYLPVLKTYVHLEDIVSERSTGKLIIPKHLHNMTSTKLSLWIRNAVYAKFEMKEGYEYVLKNNKIIYVDAKNTGVLHDTMRWSDGLHFFLEMKHRCSIESEHITTNFISHVTFFQRYSSNLIGLTGTIGGESAQRVFRRVYSADCIFIPPFRESRHYELRSYFTNDTEAWFHYIADSAAEKIKQNQAVLIITEYIEEARTIADFLHLSFPTKVKLIYHILFNSLNQASRYRIFISHTVRFGI